MVPAQQVIETVVVFGDKECHPGFASRPVDIPGHIIWMGKFRGNPGLKLIPVKVIPAVKISFQSHKENAGLHIYVLVQVRDISSFFVYKAGDRTDDAGLVRAIDE